jgi:hypothetical protein
MATRGPVPGGQRAYQATIKASMRMPFDLLATEARSARTKRRRRRPAVPASHFARPLPGREKHRL